MSSTRQETTFKAKAEYYPRRSIRGKIVLVRNVNRRQSMMDRLTNPYALGIYTGAAATGMITGMAMMARRQGNERVVLSLRKAAGASFGMEEQSDATFRRRTKTGKIAIVRKNTDKNNLRNGAIALGSAAVLGGIALSLKPKPSHKR